MDTSQEPEETESEQRSLDTDDMAGASFSCDADVSSLDVSLNFHDYDGVPEQSKIGHQCEQTVTAKLVSVATETDEEDKNTLYTHMHIHLLFVCLFCCFTSQVNSYGHCGTVSSLNHTVNQYFVYILSLVTDNNPS